MSKTPTRPGPDSLAQTAPFSVEYKAFATHFFSPVSNDWWDAMSLGRVFFLVALAIVVVFSLSRYSSSTLGNQQPDTQQKTPPQQKATPTQQSTDPSDQSATQKTGQVSGLIALPEEIPEWYNGKRLVLSDAIVKFQGTFDHPKPKRPKDFFQMSREKRRAWSEANRLTEEYRVYQQKVAEAYAKRPVFKFPVNADGTFTATGLKPDRYDIAVLIPHSAAEKRSENKQSYATSFRQIVLKAGGKIKLSKPFKLRIQNVLMPGDTVPDFIVADYEGNNVQLSSLRGKYVILDFWAVWCSNCIAEMPSLKKLHDELGADKLCIMALSMDDKLEDAQAFHQKQPVPYLKTHVGGFSSDQTITKAFGVTSIPSLWLIDPNGKIVARDLQHERLLTEVRKHVWSKAPKKKLKMPAPFQSKNRVPTLLYTFNKFSISALAASARQKKGQINCADMGDFIVFPESQNFATRSLSDVAIAELRAKCPGKLYLVGTRWDLLFTTEGPNSPTLLQNITRPVPGPVWDFIPNPTTGPVISSPPASAQAENLNAPNSLQNAIATLETAGWKFINKNQTRPFPFVKPYEPRINHATKEIWFNNLSMDLSDPDWRASITDLVQAYESYLTADGVFFQFPKPQHYGNRVATTFVEHSKSGTIGNVKTRFVRFDHWKETPYDWFKGLEQIYWAMRGKTAGLFVVDFFYFGITVNRYAEPIITQWAAEEGITLDEARDKFYRSIKTMGDAADYVISFNLGATPTDPQFAAPDWVEKDFNLIQPINLKRKINKKPMRPQIDHSRIRDRWRATR